MSSEPANPRPQRLVLPTLQDGQRMQFIFDDDFPGELRRPEAERVLAARQPGKSTSVVVLEGMHVHVREREDVDWHPVGPRRRGRPRTPAPIPPQGRGYEWSDDAVAKLRPQVLAIVGNRDDRLRDTDRRRMDDGTIVSQLYALAATFLERRRRPQAKASAITMELVAWKGGIRRAGRDGLQEGPPLRRASCRRISPSPLNPRNLSAGWAVEMPGMAARTPLTSAQPKRRLGKIADAATVLNCSVDTIDRFIRAGRLPIVRLPPGRRRVDLEELDRLINDWKAEGR